MKRSDEDPDGRLPMLQRRDSRLCRTRDDGPPTRECTEPAVRDEITEIFGELSDREDVRAIVLTGAGKVFSAGADIKERRGMKAESGFYRRHNRVTRESFYAVMECEKPVITAINGPALGPDCRSSPPPRFWSHLKTRFSACRKSTSGSWAAQSTSTCSSDAPRPGTCCSRESAWTDPNYTDWAWWRRVCRLTSCCRRH